MIGGISQHDKHVIDVVAASTSVGTFMAEHIFNALPSLPTIALILTIVWTMIRIWETDTIKKLTGRGEYVEKTNDD